MYSIRRLAGGAHIVVLVGLALGFVLLVVDSLGFKHDIRKTLAVDRYLRSYDEYRASRDLISDDVGVIQFLKRGYSVTLSSAQYDDKGLTLSGALGNPFSYSISSLTLVVEVTEQASAFLPFLSSKDDKDGDVPEWKWPQTIGSGQTYVGYLGPGSTTPFTVTIPNVIQKKGGLWIAVRFSGERYSY